MLHGFFPFPGDEGEAVIGVPCGGAQKLVRADAPGLLQGQVQLRPVAGGQKHRAQNPGLAGEGSHRIRHRRLGEAELFPQGHGCQTVVQAGHYDVHSIPPCLPGADSPGSICEDGTQQRALSFQERARFAATQTLHLKVLCKLHPPKIWLAQCADSRGKTAPDSHRTSSGGAEDSHICLKHP